MTLVKRRNIVSRVAQKFRCREIGLRGKCKEACVELCGMIEGLSVIHVLGMHYVCIDREKRLVHDPTFSQLSKQDRDGLVCDQDEYVYILCGELSRMGIFYSPKTYSEMERLGHVTETAANKNKHKRNQ